MTFAAGFGELQLRARLWPAVAQRRRVLVVELEDLLARELVGQAGNAAADGARAVGDQELALAAQQVGHLLLFGGADGAVEQGGGDGLVGHRLDVLVFEVHRHGPEDDVHRLDDAEDVLGQVNDGFFAASARGAPVEGDFGFRHEQPPSCWLGQRVGRARRKRRRTRPPSPPLARRSVPFPCPTPRTSAACPAGRASGPARPSR